MTGQLDAMTGGSANQQAPLLPTLTALSHIWMALKIRLFFNRFFDQLMPFCAIRCFCSAVRPGTGHLMSDANLKNLC